MSDNPEQKTICSHPNCNREVFENNDKCILHSEKDDWFETKPNGQQLWFNKTNIALFWKEFKEYKDKKIFNIIFPEFLQPHDANNQTFVKDLDHKFDCYKDSNNFYNLDFYNCIFLGETDFPDNLSEFIVKDSIFFRSIRIDFNGSNQINIKFHGSEFINSARLIFSGKNTSLEIIDSIFNNDFHFIGIVKRILVKDCSFNRTFISLNPLDNLKPVLRFVHNTFDHEVYILIVDLIVGKMEFVYCTINELMKLTSKGYWENSSTHFRLSAINNLRFFHSLKNNNSEIFVNVKDVSILVFEEELSNGKIIIKDLSINNQLDLKECNFENAVFTNCDFIHSKIMILNTLLFSGTNNFICNNVKWPETESMSACDRDTFRQLKQANEKQGNFIEANNFYSAEMEAYKKEIKSDKSSRTARDRFVFDINYLISDFSRNWLLSLGWFLIFGFLFASIYFLKIDQINSQNIVAWVVFLISTVIYFYDFYKYNNVKSFLTFLVIISGINYFMNVTKDPLDNLFIFTNPLNTSGIEDNDGRLIWWILFRIISVFVIYQFITALRRQTRR
jgi:hypothetical protein